MSAKKRTVDHENSDNDKRTKVDEVSQEDKISISVDDDDLNLSPGYHLKLLSPGNTSEHSRDSFRENYSDVLDDSEGFQLSKQTGSGKRAGRKYRSAKDRDLDREDAKPQSDRSRRSDDRKGHREKTIRTDEGRRARDRDNRRGEQQLKLPSNRQRHSDQRGDNQKRRTLDVRRHERERSREDDRRRQGRGLERRPSPMPNRRRDRPNRSRSPRERQPREHHPRDEYLYRQQTHNRNESSEKKEEIGSSVPSDDEALDKLAQEVDKELAQRGISPKVPMTTVDISSSDNGSSDEEDVSEEETKGEDDSQRHNSEDGELLESDETSMTEESNDEDDSPYRGPVIKSRMLRKAISGYGEGDSDASSSPEDLPRHHSVTPPPTAEAMEETPVDDKPPVEPAVEETINTPSIDPNLPPYYPALYGCRNVEEYEWLNRIEEGTYGVVYRAKDKRTGEVVALKKLKMEKEKEGFPITSLREINTLLKSHHPNIINVREVVFSKIDKIFIVMDYVEHDLKSLMETMKQPFLEGEVKTLLRQLLSAVEHLHDNWILHRDIKTSNLLLGHNGILRVGDFGLAREYGSPLKGYTPIVVTLWYRAPELLLGAKEYSTAVDIWSVGCVFAELLLHKALFKGKSEIDQINQIFKELGTPNEKIWPGYNELPCVKKAESSVLNILEVDVNLAKSLHHVSFKEQPFNNLRKKFPYLTKCGFDLLNRFLTYDPKKRITAEEALAHEYFKETPLPVDPSMFPTWPAKSEMAALKKDKAKEKSPSAPEGGAFLNQVKEDDPAGGFRLTTAMHGQAAVGQGFSLRF